MVCVCVLCNVSMHSTLQWPSYPAAVDYFMVTWPSRLLQSPGEGPLVAATVETQVGTAAQGHRGAGRQAAVVAEKDPSPVTTSNVPYALRGWKTHTSSSVPPSSTTSSASRVPESPSRGRVQEPRWVYKYIGVYCVVYCWMEGKRMRGKLLYSSEVLFVCLFG